MYIPRECNIYKSDTHLPVVTITSKEHCPWFRKASVHVYTTVVLPNGKKAPGSVLPWIVVVERSTQVGGIQETIAPGIPPTSAVPPTPTGKPTHCGSVVSTGGKNVQRNEEDKNVTNVIKNRCIR